MSRAPQELPEPGLDVLVVGAGISGLSTAFPLVRAGLRVAVLEASPRVGGAMETWTEGLWRFELGPNTVLDGEDSVRSLIREAGLEPERIAASPTARRRYLWTRGSLHALPSGPVGLLGTRLFSAGAKVRVLREPWVGRRLKDSRDGQDQTDESVADFIRRRLGREILERAAGPFVSGVWAGDPERLSARWALPKLVELEREHGSLIRGALARRGQSRRGQLRGKMISFRQGLERLPLALAQAIGDVRTGVACRRLVREEKGFVAETGAGPVRAARVVLAVPADAAARLLDGATGGRSRAFAEIPYAPVAVVSTGWRRADVGHPLGGFGFLAPRGEGLRVLGCLFPSEIFPDRAPDGHVALTAFLGGRTDPEVVDWDDGRIAGLAEEELRRALGLRGAPRVRVVRRWPRAIPQYELGHGRFVELAARLEAEMPGLHFGGNFLRGISVPDCVRNAAILAERLLADRSPGIV